MSEQMKFKDAHKVDETSFPYIFEENAVVPLKTSSQGIVRVNVYRPKSTKDGTKLPVLVTYGPYGKDIHYKEYVLALSPKGMSSDTHKLPCKVIF